MRRGKMSGENIDGSVTFEDVRRNMGASFKFHMCIGGFTGKTSGATLNNRECRKKGKGLPPGQSWGGVLSRKSRRMARSKILELWKGTDELRVTRKRVFWGARYAGGIPFSFKKIPGTVSNSNTR